MSARVLFSQQYSNHCLLIGIIPCAPSLIESLGWITPSKMPEYRTLHGSEDVTALSFREFSEGSYFAAVIPNSLFADGAPRLAFRRPNSSKVFLPHVSPNSHQFDDSAWVRILDFIESECNSLHLIGANIPELARQLRVKIAPTKADVFSNRGSDGQFEEISQGCACGWLNVSLLGPRTELLIWGRQRLLGFGNVDGGRPDLKLIGMPGNPCGFCIPLTPLWVKEADHLVAASSDGGVQMPLQSPTKLSDNQIDHIDPAFFLLDHRSTISLYEADVAPRLPLSQQSQCRLMIEKLQVCIELADSRLEGIVNEVHQLLPKGALIQVKTAEFLFQTGNFKAAMDLLNDCSDVSEMGKEVLKNCVNVIQGFVQ